MSIPRQPPMMEASASRNRPMPELLKEKFAQHFLSKKENIWRSASLCLADPRHALSEAFLCQSQRRPKARSPPARPPESPRRSCCRRRTPKDRSVRESGRGIKPRRSALKRREATGICTRPKRHRGRRSRRRRLVKTSTAQPPACPGHPRGAAEANAARNRMRPGIDGREPGLDACGSNERCGFGSAGVRPH